MSENNTQINKNIPKDFTYELESFADLRILRYKVPGFETLTLKQKKLIYYLSEASKCGRDILFDQNGRYNLWIRKVLELIYLNYTGNKTSDEWSMFEVYLKRVWFSNGIYHHYSTDKITPEFSENYFELLLEIVGEENIPQYDNLTKVKSLKLLKRILFDKDFLPKKVCQQEGVDMVKDSAVNFYADLNQGEVENYYSNIQSEKTDTPVAFGLNSKLIKQRGEIVEQTYTANSMYGQAIQKIVFWLSKAADVAENESQQKGLQILIDYYQSGDLKLWDEYNILWVQDLASHIDYVNGFIENYADPMGMKATWESIVNFKDAEATKRTEIISNNAQWFEDNSPIDHKFKKEVVKGVSAKVITVAMLGGDCYPHTPIGINLPNSEWIRKEHGSKSVTIENITEAYSQANMSTGEIEEFSYSDSEVELLKKHGALAGNLHVDLHECLGHGSGKVLPDVKSESLKNYYSSLEETRADLFALYFTLDPQMIELGLMDTLDVGKAEYISYFRNGLMTQLKRIEPGKNIEQAHMRNRQLISRWCYEQGKADKVIEKIIKDGKTYFVIKDFDKLRSLIGRLLREVQRIKSEGDYEAGKNLVENYAVEVDVDLHEEVLQRFDKLKIPSFSGFVNPIYEPIINDGEIMDIRLHYAGSFAGQMLDYSKHYAFLPLVN